MFQPEVDDVEGPAFGRPVVQGNQQREQRSLQGAHPLWLISAVVDGVVAGAPIAFSARRSLRFVGEDDADARALTVSARVQAHLGAIGDRNLTDNGEPEAAA